MDFIKAEIESKKRALDHVSKTDSVSSSNTPPQKYIKRAHLERQRVEDLQQEERQSMLLNAATALAQAEDILNATTLIPSSSSSTITTTTTATDSDISTLKVDLFKPEAFNVSNEEAVVRLRKKGQPIRLFGETDKERRLRLRALELIEERSEGQQNDFMRAMDGMEKGMVLHELTKAANAAGGGGGSDQGKGKGKQTTTEDGPEEALQDGKDEKNGFGKTGKPREENVIVDVSLVRTNPHKIYPQIYHALKKVLKEWEQSLQERAETVKRSTQGKIVAATQQTSAEYLKPLFKSLRKRDLAPDVLQAIAEITYNMQIREYLRANDAYLRLSIGNAPWPIGVTMVGIHERSGREKIFSNNVAHVLNDETSRKYIQSLKRLLTFAQTKYPPDDLSQKMG